jgi:hypothetical protein
MPMYCVAALLEQASTTRAMSIPTEAHQRWQAPRRRQHLEPQRPCHVARQQINLFVADGCSLGAHRPAADIDHLVAQYALPFALILLQDQAVYRSPYEKTVVFFEFSLCLSRAYLGKKIHFMYKFKWLKTTVFLPVAGNVTSSSYADASASASAPPAPAAPVRGSTPVPLSTPKATGVP